MRRFSPPAEQHKILLVDDNKNGLLARSSVLRELGYSVTSAGSGEEGLEILQAAKFDLVVTDYKMPKMDGVKFIGKIREAFPSMRIIMLSGFVDALALTEQSTGADVVMMKSTNEVQNLIRNVSRLLNPRIPRKPAGSQRGALKSKSNTI